MNFIESNFTTLRMLPVCECGQVISDWVMSIDIDETSNGLKFVTPSFSPSCCPNCGKTIEYLRVDGQFKSLFAKER